MFCGTQWSKIWESEVQRVNRICCVVRPCEVRAKCNGVRPKGERMFFNFLGVERVIFERELDGSPKNIPLALFLKLYRF